MRPHEEYKMLQDEIELGREFESNEEGAILAYLTTSQRMYRLAYQFFARYGLTDIQFNILILLWDQRHKKIRQWELAERLLVNRASLGGVVDRMITKGLLQQETDPDDRRALCVSLTEKGLQLLKKVKGPYYKLLSQAFGGFGQAEIVQFMNLLRRFRTNINQLTQ